MSLKRSDLGKDAKYTTIGFFSGMPRTYASRVRYSCDRPPVARCDLHGGTLGTQKLTLLMCQMLH